MKDENGKYWFADPEDSRFLSIGVNTIRPAAWNPTPGTQYYEALYTIFEGSIERWKFSVTELLNDNGFNTFGSWSSEELNGAGLFETVCLYVAGHAEDRCLEGFRPGFEERVRENVRTVLSQYPERENILGFFLDNEMQWFGRSIWVYTPNFTLLELAVSLPADDPAHRAARSFLADRYASAQAFSQAWGVEVDSWNDVDANVLRRSTNDRAREDRDGFIELAAERFFEPASRIVREMVPGKLILGTRFAKFAPEPVVRACGRHCDVVSVNDYRNEPKADPNLLAEYWLWGGKPIMITEYSWRARENTSGNPNSRGAGTVVATQADRAANYSAYIEDLISYPMVLGAHWFEFADQSPQGRFDGEDSNYGIVDIYHRPYTELLEAMERTNARADRIHAESFRPAPTSLPERDKVVFDPGQYPDRPPELDLLTGEPVQDLETFQAEDASVTVSRGNKGMTLQYQTGNEWGCGVSFFGPRSYALDAGPSFATDLDGYTTLVLDAEIPEGVLFEIVIDEAGVSYPGADSYDTGAGDDGESFAFPPSLGKGERSRYRFELKDVRPRTTWGNQAGQRRVDTYALKGPAILLHEGQGSGSIRIHSLKLVR